MAQTSQSDALLSVLEEATLGPRQLWLWLLCAGGTFMAGYSMFVLGVAVPLLKETLHLNPETIGLIGAALMLGGVLGSAVGGPAADRYGRKRLMLVDMGVLAIGGGLSAFCDSGTVLFVGQLLIGVGIGIDFAAAGPLVTEIIPQQSRGRMMVATIACQPVGMITAGLLSLFILKSGKSASVWHLLFATEAMIGMVFLVLRFSLLESPHWLVTKDKITQAAQVLQKLVPKDQEKIRALLKSEPAELSPIQRERRVGLSLLFSTPYRNRTLLVSVPWFLMDILTYGVGLFTPAILLAMHGGGESMGLLSVISDARGSTLIDLSLLAGSLLSLWVVPRFGRLFMQKFGFIGMALGLCVLFLSLKGMPGWVFGGFILFNLMMNMGPNATTFAMAPNYFPTEIRASASGFAASFAKMGAALGVFMLPILKQNYGMGPLLIVLLGVSLACFLSTLFFERKLVSP